MTKKNLFAWLFVLSVAAPASASLTWVGLGQTSTNGGVYDDVAYDNKHDVYLHVWEAQRNVWGRFIGSDGTPRGNAFIIATTFWSSFAGNPKVAYSTGTADDVFFVGFSSDWNVRDRSKNVFGQLVRYTGTGPNGGEMVNANFAVSEQSGNWQTIQTMCDVVYNPATRQFLVAWDDSRGGTDVFVRLFSAGGAPAGGDVNVSNAPWSQGLPAVSVDWRHNRYFVVYQGLHPNSPAFPEVTGSWAKILDGTTAAPVTGLIELSVGGSPIEMDTVYLPEADTFLAFWTAFEADGRHVKGRQVPYNFDATGVFASGVYPVMSTAGEGGANAVYNPATRTALIASMFVNGRIRGAELSGTGAIVTPSFTMSTALWSSVGSFWPRVATGPNTQFAFVYGIDYATTWLERYSGVAASTPGPSFGGPGSTPGPAPAPAPVSNPRMMVDIPRTGSRVSAGAFVVAGWALDLGATSNPGVDVVHVWAYPVSGGMPTFVGASLTGGMRPDVGAAFGAQFSTSGFAVTGTLAGGTYDLVAYAHSMISGTFNNVQVVRITVPQSIPRMTVDTPFANQAVARTFTVAGWALDLGSVAGTGIDVVHVWAYPVAGGNPIFFGAAALSGYRPDVGAVYGGQWATSGFSVTGTLGPGAYHLVVYAHSVVTNTFNNAVLVPIVVP